MNKFFHHIFSLILVISLFSIPKVSASTYNFTITDEYFSYLDNLETMISVVENSPEFIQKGPYYILGNLTLAPNQYFVNFHSSTSDLCMSYQLSISSNRPYYLFYRDFSSFYQGGYVQDNNPYSSNLLLLYSNFDIGFCNSAVNTYNFTYNSDVYSITSDTTLNFPTLNDLKNHFLGSPTPSDDYPILSDFFSITIDRLEFLLDEFSSNYIYISIITIFLFLTIIYFIKRRFT